MEMITATAPRRLRWPRWLALFLAAVVASLGTVAVVAPTPARAATHVVHCFTIYKHVFGGWYIAELHCIEVPLAYNPNPCCIQDYGLDLAVNPALSEEIQRGYLARVGTGLSLLAQAAQADPRTAAALRSQAQESLLGAARQLRDSKVTLNQVGTVDIANVRFDPEPLPWLESAGVDITDGLGLMQRALADPRPLPLVDAGMARFENAAAQLAAPQERG